MNAEIKAVQVQHPVKRCDIWESTDRVKTLAVDNVVDYNGGQNYWWLDMEKSNNEHKFVLNKSIDYGPKIELLLPKIDVMSNRVILKVPGQTYWVSRFAPRAYGSPKYILGEGRILTGQSNEIELSVEVSFSRSGRSEANKIMEAWLEHGIKPIPFVYEG